MVWAMNPKESKIIIERKTFEKNDEIRNENMNIALDISISGYSAPAIFLMCSLIPMGGTGSVSNNGFKS